MEVFKTKQPMRILNGYDRYELLANQLVKTDNVKLIEFFRSNSNFEPIVDEVLTKLAPDIRQVLPIEDPMRMRKQDVINELRRYKISVDIYSFSEQLSQQLIMARKLLKRNFVTVLDRKGNPTFIDDADLPVPASPQDELYLSEPEEPKEEYTTITSKDEFKLKKSTVMSMVESKDELEEINEGTSYEEFVQNVVEGKNPLIDEKQKKIDDFMKKQEEENKLKHEELTREKVVAIENIIPENYAYLIDYPVFMKKKELSPKEKENIKKLDLRTINIDVFEIFMRHYNLEPQYSEDIFKNRWVAADTIKKYMEQNNLEKERIAVELNMLQLRHYEIDAQEPDYNTTSLKQLKTRITSLQKYGAETWCPTHHMLPGAFRNFTAKMYAVVKLGIAVPKTEEGINELLLSYRKTNIVKVINNNEQLPQQE